MIRKVAALLIVLGVSACGGGGRGSGASGPTAPSGLTYPSPPTYTVGTAITPLSPTMTGTVSNYSVSPALPAGLAIDSVDGVISGTPTAAASTATYTVTANNSGGATTDGVVITVAPAPVAAPRVSYPKIALALTVGTAVNLVPVNAGGPASSWSVSPALPAGLALSPTTGALTGTPTTPGLAATYVVTAENSGGKGEVSLTLQVDSAVLLDLGHVTSIDQLWISGSRLLSQDASVAVNPQQSLSRCNLWNTATATPPAPDTLIAAFQCTGQSALAGQNVVIEGPIPAVNGLQVLAAASGAVESTITTPFSWWKLASDGSYIVIGSKTALTVFSPSGTSLFSKAGDYSSAESYAAPGAVLVALGPAGQNVIQTISVPSGTASTGPAFTGTFNEWFPDGSHFQTTAGTSVYTYTSASVKADLTSLSTVQGLGGEGNWFWIIENQNLVNVYAVGSSATPALSVPASNATLLPSGTTLGVVPTAAGTSPPQLIVVDLSGASPVQHTYTLPAPMAYTTAYAAASATDWFAGNRFGVLLDGTTLAATPGYLTYGAAQSVAGGGTTAAIATASGRVVVMDVPTHTVELTIPGLSNDVQMSADGSVLAVGYSASSPYYVSDDSLSVYSLPSGSLINSWPYAYGSGTQLSSFTLAPTGTLIAQVTMPFGSITVSRQVTSTTSNTNLWSDSTTTMSTLPSPLFSPDGTLIAASNGNPFGPSGIYSTLTTDVYRLSSPLTPLGAASGWGVGWITNSELLVNAYDAPPTQAGAPYSGATIYSPTGTVVAATAMPQILSLIPISATSIYSPDTNSIYSIPAGTLTFGSSVSFLVGVGGTFISPDLVFPWGSFVVTVQD